MLIELQFEGMHAIVDDDDATRVGMFDWRIMNTGYIATGSVENRPNKTPRNDFMLLHRFILGLPRGRVPEVDHRNRLKHDCRKENLRIVDHKVNMQNSFGYKDYAPKGVTQMADGLFRAMVRNNGQLIHLGVFNTIEEAYAHRLEWERNNWQPVTKET